MVLLTKYVTKGRGLWTDVSSAVVWTLWDGCSLEGNEFHTCSPAIAKHQFT